MRQAIVGMAVVALATAVSGSARADGKGFALDHFNPSERGSDWFASESLDLRGHLRPAFGVIADYGYKPLVLAGPNGDESAAIVSHQAFVHAGGSLVLWDRLRLGVSVPVLVSSGGESAIANGVVEPKPASSSGLGDVRLGADARVAGKYGTPLTVALGVQAHLPTGDPDSYTSDGVVRVTPRVLVASKLGKLEAAVSTGFQFRGDTEYAGGHLGAAWGGAASVGIRLLNDRLLVGPELFGSTVLQDGALKMRSSPIEGLLGAHYAVAPDWRVGAGVASGMTAGFGTARVRGLLSVEWAPGAPPPPPPDRDRDGVLDSADACPDVKGVKTDDATTNGCPPDRDQDGIVDAADACPDVKGVKSDDPKANGCPPDRDQDGILDADDACPDAKGVTSSEAAKHGCPVDPDRDKDGIANEADACPDEAGPANDDAQKRGCPQAFVAEGQIKILDQVKFRSTSAEILPGKDSEDVLQAVLGVLKKHPEIKLIRVEGHTDDRGTAALNRKLSADRAASVVEWLTAHGIDKATLSSAGFGPDHPLTTNLTDDGRRANRRVEFHIEEPAK